MDATSLPNDVFALQALVQEQIATLHAQSVTLAAQQREIEQLKHYVALLLRARYGPRSEKVDPNQLALFDAQVGEDSSPPDVQDDDTSLDVVVREHRRRGGGRTALPENLPREQVEHDLAEGEKACPACGRLRERIGADTSEQLELVPAQLKIIEHVRHKYACRHCQEHVARAPAAAKPIEKGLPGPGLLAQLVVSKYAEHKPLYRFEDELARYGVEISRGTLCRWARWVADLVTPLYDLMAARVRMSRIIWTDDTPMPVLDASLPHTRTARLWVYCGDRANPYTVYDYTTSRKRDGPAAFLKDFAGYLQADAFAGYDGIYAAGTVKQVLCWAHARRKFFEAKETHPEGAHRALAFISLLYDVEREAKELEPQRRLKLRRARSLGILERFHIWLLARQTDVLPKSPLGQAIGYVLPRWNGFVRYCEDGDLSIDNNLSERMIRPCTIGRKNYLFFGSDRGGRTAAVLYSLMASCKANSVEPWAYLRDMLTRLSNQAQPPSESLAILLPDAWLQFHPDHRRTWAR
jgi:transposase